MVCAIGGLQKSGKFTCSGDAFQGCWLRLILMIVSTQKYGQLIIVIYINGLCYRGSSEMSQMHVQWSHFSRLSVTFDFDDSFNTKIWSFSKKKAKNVPVFLQK